jgi:D-alanyl-D-alanine carboxypeptidase
MRRKEIAALFAVVFAMPVAAVAGPSLLFDAASGVVLYAEDLDQRWHPASLTKIMTAYLTFGAIRDGTLRNETAMTCSAHASSQGPTKIGLPAGKTMSVETGLQALILESANDAAVMLAEAVAGSHEAFVEQMNATALRLGMTRTGFANANGLPAPEQVTTARDMGRLAAAIVRDFPQYAPLWSMHESKMGSRQLRTHNGLLLSYAGADGMKTGFTCDSGFNVVASATRNDTKLVAVVLGERTKGGRSLRAANLLEHGFQTREWKALFSADTLESYPVTDDAAGPITMRDRVISWVCGTARRFDPAGRNRGQSVADPPRRGEWSPW